MGALARATKAEVAELGAGFWDAVFESIAGGGSLTAVAVEHGWSFGALCALVDEDEELRERYARALRWRADWVHEECIPIADGSGDAKLRVQERRKSAAVWHQAKYGEKVDVRHSGVQPVLVIEIAREAGKIERVVEQVEDAQLADEEI